jgi:hypothetical protein
VRGAQGSAQVHGAPQSMERTIRQLRGNARFESMVDKVIEAALVHVEDKAYLVPLLKGRHELPQDALPIAWHVWHAYAPPFSLWMQWICMSNPTRAFTLARACTSHRPYMHTRTRAPACAHTPAAKHATCQGCHPPRAPNPSRSRSWSREQGSTGHEGVKASAIAVTFQATLCEHLLQTLPTPASLPAPPRRFLALTLSRFQCRSHWQSRVCPQWEGKVRLCAYEARCSRLLQTRRHQGAMC